MALTDHHPKDHSKKELAQWLGQYGGIDITHAALLKVFPEHLASGTAHNHPARVGKRKQETLGASTATQGAAKCSLTERIQCQQLDSDLDKDTAAAVASSSTIIMNDPTFLDSCSLLHMLRMIIWIPTCRSSSARSCMTWIE
jgi:hypothetical protein